MGGTRTDLPGGFADSRQTGYRGPNVLPGRAGIRACSKGWKKLGAIYPNQFCRARPEIRFGSGTVFGNQKPNWPEHEKASGVIAGLRWGNL